MMDGERPSNIVHAVLGAVSFFFAMAGTAIAATNTTFIIAPTEKSPSISNELRIGGTACLHDNEEIVRLAAETGNVAAMTILGEMHLSGVCLARNQDVAIEYLSRAASLGHTRAAYLLGEVYFTDQDGFADRQLAAQFFRQAGERGHHHASHRLGLLILTEATSSTERLEGLSWLGAAASYGHSLSAASIAMIHERGMYGVDTDICWALDWYHAAEAMGLDYLRDHRSDLEAEWAHRCY
ncbi:MAG: tetratricopeptide repeat protein [Pseudomonadota bacterium]